MPPHDVSHTRKYSLCLKFSSSGACAHANCVYSHTLIDVARIHALVGDISTSPSHEPMEKTYCLVEYTKYSSPSSSETEELRDPKDLWWRMRLLAGGRATLAPLGTEMAAVESISVQPVYPLKGQGVMAGIALHALEEKVFGSSPSPDPIRRSVCKAFVEDNACHRSAPTCRFSHTLFDTARVETLIDSAIAARGQAYRDLRPLLEIELVGLPPGPGTSFPAGKSQGTSGDKEQATGQPRLVWRVTLRCVVSYQKDAPQPVVATSADLGTAMRMLEAQIAGSSSGAGGAKTKSPPPSPSQRRWAGRTQQHNRNASAGNTTPLSTSGSTTNSNASSSPNSNTNGNGNSHNATHSRSQSRSQPFRGRGRGGAHTQPRTSVSPSPSTTRSSPASTDAGISSTGAVELAVPPPSYTDAMGGIPPSTGVNPDSKHGRR